MSKSTPDERAGRGPDVRYVHVICPIARCNWKLKASTIEAALEAERQHWLEAHAVQA